MNARGASLWLLFLCAAAALPTCAEDAALRAAGMRIYREGILPSGAPVAATGRNGTPLQGAGAACASCHQRSGYGTSEGRSVVNALPPLFDRRWIERSELRARPVGSGRQVLFYTVEALARALREGLGAAGAPLDGLMPRYRIDDESVRALEAYLKSLATAPAPGVTPTTLRLATVVTPDADPGRAAAMLRVLRTFVADKNGGTRSEARRRSTGSEWMYQGHRRWELDVWELQGARQTWAGQLESFQRERPAFLLLSGLGAGTWEPVHAFCERLEIPCVLPNAAAPAGSTGFYSIYFSRGIDLDGALLGRHLRDRGASPGPVVQVHRAGGAGGEAARALREALPREAIVDIELEAGAPIAPALRELASREPGFTLALWLAGDDLAQLPAAAAHLGGASEIYVSAGLADPARIEPGEALRPRLRVIHPFDLPAARAPRLARARAWFAARGIPVDDEAVQANTFFAATLVADAVGHIVDVHSREYLVERIEHMASRMPNTSLYPRIGLAPGQRYASKGGYIALFSAEAPHALVAASAWIVP